MASMGDGGIGRCPTGVENTDLEVLAAIPIVANTSASIVANRRPAGTATMNSVTEMISIWVKAKPFS